MITSWTSRLPIIPLKIKQKLCIKSIILLFDTSLMQGNEGLRTIKYTIKINNQYQFILCNESNCAAWWFKVEKSYIIILKYQFRYIYSIEISKSMIDLRKSIYIFINSNYSIIWLVFTTFLIINFGIIDSCWEESQCLFYCIILLLLDYTCESN